MESVRADLECSDVHDSDADGLVVREREVVERKAFVVDGFLNLELADSEVT